jgi:hypothetical protein
MNHPAIEKRLLSRDTADPRETVDYIGERFAYLGLCLARAAARCGASEGYERLVDYVGEIRLYLARSARRELKDLLQTDCGYQTAAWRAEIEKRNGEFTPIPYREVLL